VDDQLQRLIQLQEEQNQLLKRYLWRFRFSLMALLLLTTVTCFGLGLLVYRDQSKVPAAPTPVTTGVWSSSGTISLSPATPQTGSGDLELFKLEQPSSEVK
jgi:hypothetical protein